MRDSLLPPSFMIRDSLPSSRPRSPAGHLCVLSPRRARALDQTTGGADLGDTDARPRCAGIGASRILFDSAYVRVEFFKRREEEQRCTFEALEGMWGSVARGFLQRGGGGRRSLRGRTALLSAPKAIGSSAWPTWAAAAAKREAIFSEDHGGCCERVGRRREAEGAVFLRACRARVEGSALCFFENQRAGPRNRARARGNITKARRAGKGGEKLMSVC